MEKTAAHQKTITPITLSPALATQEITLVLTLDEAQKLKLYCDQTGKAADDVVQELIQELPVR